MSRPAVERKDSMVRLSRYSRPVLLSSLIMVVAFLGPIRPTHALSSTPTYVLGVTNPLDPLIIDLQNLTSSVTLLSSTSSLSLVGANSILFVDGSWLATQYSLDPTVLSLLVAEALAGVPTVTIRGNAALLSTSISGVYRWHDPSLPLLSEGIRVAGTLPDGTRISTILQIVSGFDYAVQAEFTWANSQLTQTATGAVTPLTTQSRRMVTSSANTTTTTNPPYWQTNGFLTVNTGDYFYPYGRIITTVQADYLKNSGSGQYFWDNVFLNQTIQPGIMIYNSPWRTSTQNALFHDLNTTSIYLVDHGPKNVINSGPFVVSYDIGVYAGVLGGVVNSTESRSYNLKHTNVTDTSQYPDVSMLHTIDARTSAGTLTFTVIPGCTIRYLTGSTGSQLQIGIATTFVELQGGSIVGSKTTTVGMFPG